MRHPFKGLLLASLAWLTLCSPLAASPAASTPAPAGSTPAPESNPFANAPGKKEFPNASAIILKDDIQAIVNADGTHDLVEYDAIKILDKAGVDRFGHTSRLYDSKVESIEVPVARLIAPDGKVTVLPAGAITDGTPEGLQRTQLYQRIRQISIDYKDAVEGAIVEFKIVHHRKVPWNGKKFWEISYTQDFEPILDTQFTFDSPDRMPVEIATPGTPNLQPEQVTRLNGRTVMRWHMKDRPPLVHQPAMPPLRQLATQIQVSNFASWDDFGNWARTLFDGAAQPDSALTSKTASLVASITQEDGRIKALMAWLGKEKQAASGDLSLEDIAPASAAQAFRASDLLPQDRAVLLVTMLRAAGIKAYPALVATSDYGDPTRGVPSLQQFNRVLVAVATTSGWRWLDPMAAAPGVLGQGLNDRPALVLNGTNRLITTEVTPPHMNREEINGVARLDSDGSMETQLKVTEYGANSMVWRALAGSTTQKEQQQVFQLMVSNINPTAVLRDFFVPPGSEGPMQMTLSFEESRAGSRPPGGDGFQFAVPLLPQRRLISYAEVPVAQRQYPVVLGATAYEERRLQIVIPAGWTVKSLPHSVMRTNSVGSYQVEVRNDERNIYYFSRLIIRRSEIPVADYPQFKELMDQLAASATERVLLALPGTRPAGK